MYITAFEQYSSVVNDELKKNEELATYEQLADALYAAKNEQEVRDYLRANWGLRDNVLNFALTSEILISTVSEKNYLNISIQYKSLIKSYNYPKNIKNCNVL